MAAASTGAGTLLEDATIVHAGLTRYFDYYIPDAPPPGPAPLLFVLHGGTQSNDMLHGGASGEYRMLADQDGIIVVYPNGTSSASGQSGPSGSFNWNDCRADAGDATTTADDVGFISALIDWAAANFAVDLERVYATGASNGGLMSYRLALELSHRIAAIGVVIANLPADSECPPQPAHPIGVLVMNGTEDALMPWAGGQVAGNRGLVLSSAATREFWRNVLATEPTATRVVLPDTSAADASHVEIDLYCGGTEGSGLAFYTVNGGGHTLPSIAHPLPPAFASLGVQNRDIEAAAEIWRFLGRQRRSGMPSAICGDGCRDEAEACDDGNTAGGDCCSATCDAAQECAGCEICDFRVGACVSAPQAGCRRSIEPRRSTLALTNTSPDDGDRVAWKWLAGEATAAGDFGEPRVADDDAHGRRGRRERR
jgi:polyhydroxybutyrate depolymerase